MAIELRANGANAASFFCDVFSEFITLGAAEWAQLKPGKLKSLLTAPHTDTLNFYAACADAGFTTDIMPLKALGAAEWAVIDGVPELEIDSQGARPVVRLATAYSASE